MAALLGHTSKEAMIPKMRFSKYHALGNDYIVIPSKTGAKPLTAAHIRLICHRNYGIGSDGILRGPLESTGSDFGLRIFNPDGSEAEKSGNGLRIFACALFDQGRVGTEPFTIETLGGQVTCRVAENGRHVTVNMGRVSFDSRRIPVAGPAREVLNETLEIGDRKYTFCAATVGNPHCVIIKDQISADEARQYGPMIETESRFPHRINVQFVRIVDRHRIGIEIWERGAGYTLASGSSSTAAAAVAHKLGHCDSDITVEMPGGEIQLKFNPGFEAIMTGPVTPIAQGELSPEMFDIALPAP